MKINETKQKLHITQDKKFDTYRMYTIRSPVEDDLKDSGLDVSDSQTPETYLSKKEIKEYSRIPKIQQERIYETFKNSPEYRKFRKALEKEKSVTGTYENTMYQEVYGGQDSFISGVNFSEKLKKHRKKSDSFTIEKNEKVPQRNEKDIEESRENLNEPVSYKNTYNVVDSSGKGTLKSGDNGRAYVKAVSQKQTEASFDASRSAAYSAAAAGSGGTSEAAKEAVNAVKKYAEIIKEAAQENSGNPQQMQEQTDSKTSSSQMGMIQKVTAAVMALVGFLMAEIGVVIIPLLIIIAVVIIVSTLIVSIISSVAAFFTPEKEAEISGGIKMQMLSQATIAYTDDLKEAAEEEGIEKYVNYLLAIMETESHGEGNDPMQSSESAGLEPGGFTNPQDSIKQGVSYFAMCIRKAEENNCDIKCAVQSYNFGSGFIDYAASYGGTYSLELSESFAQEKSNGIKADYANDIAINYNGGFRYAYGNMFYAELVSTYIYSYEDETVQKVIDEAYKYYGWDYVSGGCSPDYGGFDCSGLVQYVYRQAGIDLPRLEKEQFAASQEISIDEIQPGDLLFYQNETSDGSIGHVAIYIGDGKTFEAGDPVGVYDIDDSWHAENFLCAGRVINRE